ncbi:MAG TPA: hypothetical protein VFM68_03980 [Candidatus Saccharimonadales bacterium]|nr:hypothetical protein [Candidatus Saccharimonadales bacterium]
MRRKESSFRPPSPYLPPRDLCLFDPKKDGLLPTPVDERGVVDSQELIHMVKTTVDPSYQWTSPYNDVHHTHWPGNRYKHTPNAEINPNEFRNLATNKLYVPRIFHNWTHKITEPPPVPSDEVMYYQIEAQRVALALFRTVRSSRKLSRLKTISDEELETRLIEQFDSFNDTVETAKKMPPEFQVIDLSNYQPRSYEDMFRLGAELGKTATASRVLRQVTRPIAV